MLCIAKLVIVLHQGGLRILRGLGLTLVFGRGVVVDVELQLIVIAVLISMETYLLADPTGIFFRIHGSFGLFLETTGYQRLTERLLGERRISDLDIIFNFFGLLLCRHLLGGVTQIGHVKKLLFIAIRLLNLRLLICGFFHL